MMITRLGIFLILAMTFSGAQYNCQVACGQYHYPPPRPNTAAAGIMGGASGGFLGAAIGSREGKAGEGALIGGLIGAAAGGILGNQADRANDLRSYHYQQQQQQRIDAAVSLNQVVQMSQSGLSNDVIANQIRRNGVRSKPTSDELIWLRQNGVSDQVLNALQNAFVASEPAGRAVEYVPTGPVYHERIIVHPAPIYPMPHYHAHPSFYYPPAIGHRHSHGPSAQLRIRF